MPGVSPWYPDRIRSLAAGPTAIVLSMPFGIGIWELLILLLVLLLVFGPKRLPEMGRQLGKGMREFKDSVTGDSHDDEHDRPCRPPSPRSQPLSPPRREQRERDTVS